MENKEQHEKFENKNFETLEMKMEPKLDIEIGSLVNRYRRLTNKHTVRDNKMSQIKKIREGKMSDLAPDIFPELGYAQEPIIANMIDIAARDMAELLAPLPSFSCVNSTMISERSRENAYTKTKVVQAYMYNSDLQVQMYTAADWYVSYGFLPFKIELDYENAMPVLRAIDPTGTYAEFDRFGNVVSFFQRITVDREDLKTLYPELADKLNKGVSFVVDSITKDVEVILYHDKNWDIAFTMFGGEQVLLEKTPNKVGKVLVKIAQRPGLAGPRGQFDDVIFVQLARAHTALLQMRATEEAIKAPISAPLDLQEMPYGDGAIIKSSQPQNIRRIDLSVPPSVIQQQQQYDRELQVGSRFPQTRTGNIDASIVTGKGVEALAGGYETQQVAHQAILARTYQELASLMLEVDECVFTDIPKVLHAAANGTPIEVKYTPSKVIKGDFSVDVRYGLGLGLDPNRWLVFALQARADKMFSREFMRRNFPMDIDVEEEGIKVDMEDFEEAAKQALMGYAQSIPVLAGQGQDPSKPLMALAKVIELRRKGVALADAIVEAMLPNPEEEAKKAQEALQAQQMMMAAQGIGQAPEGGQMPAEGQPASGEPQLGPDGKPLPPGAAEGVPEGLNVLGLMRGTAPGQQGMAPGGRPDLATMMAGLTSRGEPNLQANITRNVAI